MGLENEDREPETPPALGRDEASLTLDEFYGQAILMALARIYDVLLVQVAQGDEDLAAQLQAQHYAGGYLFPTIFPPPPDAEDHA